MQGRVAGTPEPSSGIGMGPFPVGMQCEERVEIATISGNLFHYPFG